MNAHHPIFQELPEAPEFDVSQSSLTELADQCKDHLAVCQQQLAEAFEKKTAVRYLVNARSKVIDELLSSLWLAFGIDSEKTALIAVGGYGRGELHPGSDIDLLILVERKNMEKTLEKVQPLITFLWDIGLKIGHSVRTVRECIAKAKDDITIATNLMESRLLIGQQSLFDQITEASKPSKMWPAREFYEAKVAEQKARYRKYRGSSFDLEPNLKGNPGGLRDIQLVGWIAKRHFGSDSLNDLTTKGVFTLKEYRTLIGCQSFLWRVRFALHVITGRGEDRLLFQHQKRVAEYLGYKDKKEALAVEQLMKKYFRAAITVRNVTELLLQVFEEVILDKDRKVSIQPIDDDFQIENDRIALINPERLEKEPELIFQTFITAAKTPGNKHISARTLRAIRDNRHIIDSSFRNNEKYKQQFLEFFSIKHRGDRALFLLKRNGILARFLPSFEKISGQMQFDMFHTFSVDEHTLFLLKNLTRFANDKYAEEFPYCSKIMESLDKPQLIFLAGLFHDIAKGRGGDHSELGAEDALAFCRYLNMPEEECQIVSWLVRYHLLMSITAQRKDISDPQVIEHFANQVGNQLRLDLLYILTVADIRATSPKLWNSWKDSLLRELYLATRSYLEKGSENNLSEEEYIEKVKADALAILEEKKVSLTETQKLWALLEDNYFKTTPVKRLVWQTRSVIKHAHGNTPLVEIKKHHNKGGTEIFIYAPDQPGLFAAITATISQKNLRTQAADLFTDENGMCYDAFVVLEENGQPIQSPTRIQSIRKLLQKNLKNIAGMSKKVRRHLPNRFQQFEVPTEVKFVSNKMLRYTQMELTALDQPGLLAAVGEALRKCSMSIHTARIVTLGEKVEDVFEISTQDFKPLDSEQQSQVRKAILEQFEQL